METNQRGRLAHLAGIARVLIPLAFGVALGAFLFSRFAGPGVPPHPSTVAAVTESPIEPTAPNVVHISVESQKDVGIDVEAAADRGLHEILSATGSVSEDPSRVAHIRARARGVVEKAFARLGDRVSAGEPLVEYDNIELGIAIGEYLTA